jgi:AraC-like DNA-binding protein
LLWARSHRYEPGTRLLHGPIPVYALWLLMEGEARVAFEGNVWRVESGEAFFGVPCSCRQIEIPRGAAWLSAGLSITAPDGHEMLSGLAPGSFPLSAQEHETLSTLLRLLVETAAWPGESGALTRDGLARALAGWLLRTRQAPEHFSSLPEWLRAVLGHIEQTPDASVESLAKEAHFSTAQFRRLFQRHLGVRPHEFLQRRRLDLARRLLENTELSIGEVAERSGFGGAAQFSREFKRQTQFSPLEWRRLIRESV